MVKKLPAIAEYVRDSGSIPRSGRTPGRGNCNPLQYSCLENSMDKRAWQATVHRVTQIWTQLKQLVMHAYMALLPSSMVFLLKFVKMLSNFPK